MHRFSWDTCPDCGAGPPHAPDCMTKAVQDGKMTPRERQVLIAERQLDQEARTFRAGTLIDRMQAAAAEMDGATLMVNPVDMQEILASARADTQVGPVNAGAITSMWGLPVVVSDAVPRGEFRLGADPAKVVTVGLDLGSPTFTMEFHDPARDWNAWAGRSGANAVMRTQLT